MVNDKTNDRAAAFPYASLRLKIMFAKIAILCSLSKSDKTIHIYAVLFEGH